MSVVVSRVISSVYATRLFETFCQLDMSRTPSRNGTTVAIGAAGAQIDSTRCHQAVTLSRLSIGY